MICIPSRGEVKILQVASKLQLCGPLKIVVQLYLAMLRRQIVLEVNIDSHRDTFFLESWSLPSKN